MLQYSAYSVNKLVLQRLGNNYSSLVLSLQLQLSIPITIFFYTFFSIFKKEYSK